MVSWDWDGVGSKRILDVVDSRGDFKMSKKVLGDARRSGSLPTRWWAAMSAVGEIQIARAKSGQEEESVLYFKEVLIISMHYKLIYRSCQIHRDRQECTKMVQFLY